MTVAIADTLLYQPGIAKGFLGGVERSKRYAYRFKQYYSRYPDAGFGNMFKEWAVEPSLRKQKSFANGGAMRVAPVGYAFDDLEDVLRETRYSCRYTHGHSEAMTGAQTVAAAVYLARTGCSKAKIKATIEKRFHYDLSFTLDSIRQKYVFDSRSSYSVPPAIVAFLKSDSYESAIHKAISIGGDSDTIACISGGIAHAYYKEIPKHIADKGCMLLDSGLKKIKNIDNTKSKPYNFINDNE